MDYESISKKRLMDLRVYGRAIGVKSASTLKKAELVQKIMDIQSGKEKPVYTKVGRKPLEIMQIKENEDSEKNVFNYPNTARFFEELKKAGIGIGSVQAMESLLNKFICAMKEFL